MPRISGQPKNKPQARTRATKAKILDAAQALFAELGFENTQLDEVAARAGYSRGAIYAHYPSKEKLFLALIDQRIHMRFAGVCKTIKEEPDVRKRPAIFKRWIASQVADPSWGTLNLEYKLYAVRRSESRDNLMQLYAGLFDNSGQDFVELLFGKGLSKAAKLNLQRRMAAMDGALNGMVLESYFQSGLLSSRHLRQLTEELFDTFIHI